MLAPRAMEGGGAPARPLLSRTAPPPHRGPGRVLGGRPWHSMLFHLRLRNWVSADGAQATDPPLCPLASITGRQGPVGILGEAWVWQCQVGGGGVSSTARSQVQGHGAQLDHLGRSRVRSCVQASEPPHCRVRAGRPPPVEGAASGNLGSWSWPGGVFPLQPDGSLGTLRGAVFPEGGLGLFQALPGGRTLLQSRRPFCGLTPAPPSWLGSPDHPEHIPTAPAFPQRHLCLELQGRGCWPAGYTSPCPSLCSLWEMPCARQLCWHLRARSHVPTTVGAAFSLEFCAHHWFLLVWWPGSLRECRALAAVRTQRPWGTGWGLWSLVCRWQSTVCGPPALSALVKL
nr:uncharacterized protein LOC127488398 [Oryctolagus cuniculus]XP_051693542.1 uncharacterized protein LOC127488398 [Oryctolagus cuniculus]XP_051693544.1 uncharacterized protein LOC127488398 [Oryctolagus cuniculus]XP_051693545.1 uncharacterized protein LOC127488398 [Oryctolagus cuniculus]XP_051693546.1 uncharacterized protein LOC127488398 [Oryctolagus cuniculus]XP_051693547.1 uncharacterized protein LOC127488398 [Oryctolagus cuniculus]XP_051693548.1 uncharacterized protein LOC127488398 [Orycto